MIALHHLADLTVNEVADTLNLPTGTVKARLSGVAPPSPRCSSRRDPMTEFTPLRQAVDTLASRTPSPDFASNIAWPVVAGPSPWSPPLPLR